MNCRVLMRIVAVAVVALGLQIGASGAGQKEAFIQAQQANKAALREYSWKRRTEFKLKGESKKVTLEQIRYDIDGALQKTPIGGAPDQPQPQQPSGGGRRGGRLKQRVVENKKEEFAENMKSLAQLVASYAQLPQDKLAAFAQSATIGKGEGAQAGTVRIQGSNVLVEGDSLSIWIDPASNMMRRVEIETLHEKKPVKVVSEYVTLDRGPTYQARALLTVPEKQVELTVENFEYQHVGASR